MIVVTVYRNHFVAPAAAVLHTDLSARTKHCASIRVHTATALAEQLYSTALPVCAAAAAAATVCVV
jgi:hypothetical protein